MFISGWDLSIPIGWIIASTIFLVVIPACERGVDLILQWMQHLK